MHRGETGRCAAARARRAGSGPPAARGFTLIELSIVIIVIALLATLGAVAAARAVRGGRDTAERQLLISIRQAVDSFRLQFEMLPPLVIDGPNVPVGCQPTTAQGPLSSGGIKQPLARNQAFLGRTDAATALEPRCSVYSIPYYLMGLLDMPDRTGAGAKPIDGFEGSAFSAPQADGSFSQRGAPVSAMLDTGTLRGRVWRNPTPNYAWQIVLQDRWSTPIRFYRWAPKFAGAGQRAGELEQYFVPREVGDPAKRADLRNAEYAIVSLGADKKTDEDYTSDPNHPRPRLPLPTNGVSAAPHTDITPIDASVTKDDIVEVGR